MTTRVTFKPEFLHAIQIRGLTLTELAKLAKVSPATVSAAVRGRPVNVSTATLLCRAVNSRPVLPELEAWAAHVPLAQPVAEDLAR
jgi:transcriptional regulator with XRE-family HTH domain